MSWESEVPPERRIPGPGEQRAVSGGGRSDPGHTACGPPNSPEGVSRLPSCKCPGADLGQQQQVSAPCWTLPPARTTRSWRASAHRRTRCCWHPALTRRWRPQQQCASHGGPGREPPRSAAAAAPAPPCAVRVARSRSGCSERSGSAGAGCSSTSSSSAASRTPSTPSSPPTWPGGSRSPMSRHVLERPQREVLRPRIIADLLTRWRERPLRTRGEEYVTGSV